MNRYNMSASMPPRTTATGATALRQVVARGAVALVMLAGLIGVSAPAEAYWVQTTAGTSPGSATVPIAQLVKDTTPWTGRGSFLIQGKRTVYKSPAYADRTQYVTVQYRTLSYVPPQWTWVDNTLVTFPGRWIVDHPPATSTGYISAAATSVVFPGYSDHLKGVSTTYSADVVITWRLGGPGGAVLGQKVYSYGNAGDYWFGAGTVQSYGMTDGRFGFTLML